MPNNGSFQGKIKPSYVDSEPWWPKKPDLSGKPNVLYILLDDTGFADLGCYGSLIETPNIDALASEGLRYNDFHVNSMCSPTRASLLTGCNHHAAGMGYIAELDMGFPNMRGQVKKECGFISEILKEEGYATFCTGKWHLVPPEYTTPAGPFDQWPLGRGFERYYGFLPAETSQYYPALVNGNEYVEQPGRPEDGYHFSEDMIDKAIRYIGQLKSCAPEKPFFGYISFGAHHSPHHAPKEYVDKYRGKFDEGWDACRQRIFERQKEMGIIPPNAVLSPNDYLVADWNSRTKEEQKVLARYMEAFAGFVSHTDAQIGRLINYLKKIGQYDNTLIVLLSDNGPSAEGGMYGARNIMYRIYMEKDAPMATLEEAEKFGSPDTGIQYPTAWAHVCNTPFRMYKTWNHAGGVRVPCIISYPDKIKDKGGIRSQYHHVVDINATVLDILGIEAPKEINGVRQMEKHGISMVYTFDNPEAPRRRHVQYYELLGNRALWCDGWKVVADHAANPTFDFSKDKWELYHTDEDPTEMVDLADKYPEKLRELVDMWWYEAGKYDVLPMFESNMKRLEGFISRDLFRANPQLKRTHMCYYPEFDMGRAWPIQDHSYTSRVFLKYKKGDEGVLYACGDNMGGYALFIEDGRLKMHYNFVSYAQFRAESDKELPEGAIVVGVDFVKIDDSNGVCHLVVNGETVGQVKITAHPLFSEHSHIFSIGHFSAVAVADEYRSKGLWRYTGEIDRVEFDLDRPMGSAELLKRQTEAIKND